MRSKSRKETLFDALYNLLFVEWTQLGEVIERRNTGPNSPENAMVSKEFWYELQNAAIIAPEKMR